MTFNHTFVHPETGFPRVHLSGSAEHGWIGEIHDGLVNHHHGTEKIAPWEALNALHESYQSPSQDAAAPKRDALACWEDVVGSFAKAWNAQNAKPGEEGDGEAEEGDTDPKPAPSQEPAGEPQPAGDPEGTAPRVGDPPNPAGGNQPDPANQPGT